MAESVTIELVGMDDVLNRLKKLPEKPTRRVTRKFLRAGSTPILKESRRLTPKDTGELRKAWKRSFAKSFDRDQWVKVRNPAPHAHLVEFGTGERFTKDGKSKGSMPARPFLRPAVESKKGEAVRAMVKKADEEFPKEWEKLKGRK